MAMGIYRGVSGVARKVTKIYRGVSGVARQVKNGYRGVSSVARQFYQLAVTYTTLFSDTSQQTSIGSNIGSDKSGTYTCDKSFNASNATKLQLVVAGYASDTPTMKVYLLSAKNENASSSTLVGEKVVPGQESANSTTYTFDISSFTGTRYVQIKSSSYLFIIAIKYG